MKLKTAYPAATRRTPAETELPQAFPCTNEKNAHYMEDLQGWFNTKAADVFDPEVEIPEDIRHQGIAHSHQGSIICLDYFTIPGALFQGGILCSTYPSTSTKKARNHLRVQLHQVVTQKEHSGSSRSTSANTPCSTISCWLLDWILLSGVCPARLERPRLLVALTRVLQGRYSNRCRAVQRRGHPCVRRKFDKFPWLLVSFRYA